MATIGLVDIFGAPTAAQSTDIAAELVSVNVDGAAMIGTNTHPAVSDDGSTIVFTTLSPSVDAAPGVEAAPGVYDLFIRRRATDVAAANSMVIPLRSPQLVEAGISGDGCVVAYSVVVARPVVAEINPAGVADPVVEVDPVVVADPVVEAAALQVAADVIELRTLNLCGAEGISPVTTVLDQLEGHDPLNVQPLSGPSLSTDGNVVAFAATTTLNLYQATSTPSEPAFVAVAPPVADSFIGSHLDLTADGRTIVFEAGLLTADLEDPAASIDASVYLATIEPAAIAQEPPVVTTELLAPTDAGSSWPSISADGSLVVYQSDQPLPIAGAPDAGGYIVLADRTETPTTHRVIRAGAARPDLAANGTAIAFDVPGAVQVRRSESDVPFAEFVERIANPKIGVDPAEGTGASITGAAVSADATAIVFDQSDGAALSTPVVAGGQVWMQATKPLFAPPPTTTTTTTTSTVPPQVTTPVTTNPTRTTTRNTTRTTTRPTTRNTTRTTTRPTTPATTPAVAPAVAFSPTAFEFAPTIINAGSRTAAIELSNATTRTVTVSSIAADVAGAADFTVDAAACTTLDPGATCTVNLVFAPTATGERTTTVVATMDDGTTASVALRGLGAPEPTISVLPGVASNGQVVAVVGTGFPAGAIVEFSWNDRLPTSVAIDDVGGFSQTVVVLPRTPSGPIRLAVAAQLDLFGEVTTTMLVSDSATRGNTALLGGGLSGASLGR